MSWAYAPGYVGWCPLGYDNRAVFSFSYVSGGYGYGHGYDRWHGWTVLPTRSFRPNVAVARHAVPGRSLSADVVNRFAVRRVEPDRPATGFSRAPALGSPGSRGYAVPRATAGGSRPDPGSGASAPAGRSRLGAGTVRDPLPRSSAVPRDSNISRSASPQPRAGAPQTARPESSEIPRASSSRTAPWNRPETIVGGRRAVTPPESTSRAVPRSQGGGDAGGQRTWTPPETITSRAPQGEAARPDPPAYRGMPSRPSEAPESRGYRAAPANRGEAPSRSIASPRTPPPSAGRVSPPRQTGRPGGDNTAGASRAPGRQAPAQGSGARSGGGSTGRAVPRGGRGGGGN